MKPIFVGILSLTLSGFWQTASAQEVDAREGGLTGTGIYGIITELGSIYVNGQRITYPRDLTIETALGSVLASELSPGDTVIAQVSLIDEVWVANGIRQIHPIVGPISDVDDGHIIIMGSKIDIAETGTQNLKPGDWVAVSGLWREDQVVASRLSEIEPQPFAHMLGSYAAVEEGTAFQVGGSTVTGIQPLHAENGDVIRVMGQASADSIAAIQVDLGYFDQPLGLLLAEGYLSRPDPAGRYTLLGTGLSAFTEMPEMISTRILYTFCGQSGELLSTQSNIPTELLASAEILGCTD